MIKVGIYRPALTAAHHIVAANSLQVADVLARAILKKYGIRINDGDNGVFLPQNRLAARISSSSAAVHSTLHTKKYYETVYQMLSQAYSENDVRAILSEIRSELLAGGL